MTSPETRRISTKLTNKRRIVNFIYVIIVLGLLPGVLLSCSSTPAAPALIVPSSLEGLPLVEQTTGQEAVSDMEGLHGTDIRLVDGYVAHYEKDGRRVIVWFGQAENDGAAEQLLDRMTEKIGAGNVYFSTPEQQVIEGEIVYSTTGGGEDHYYYRSADAVIWLAVSAPEPLKLLRSAIRILE